MVSVLFARSDSIYRDLGCDVWDYKRDARTWLGRAPAIYHPPCRAWGRYAHRSKHDEWERTHALWALDMVRCFGGVVEHPVTSRLWKHLLPGERPLVVDQHWFGHRARKRTGLFIVGAASLPAIPLSLDVEVPVEHMSRAERERTPLELARWLVQVVTSIPVPSHQCRW